MKPFEAHPGLYLHIPFCSRICPYCDFAVLTGGPERRRRFSDHLVREISMWADEKLDIRVHRHPILRRRHAVRFGGGEARPDPRRGTGKPFHSG